MEKDIEQTIIDIQQDGAEVKLFFAPCKHTMKWMPVPGMGGAKGYTEHLRKTILGTKMGCPSCNAEREFPLEESHD